MPHFRTETQKAMDRIDVIGAGRWGQTLIHNLVQMDVLGAVAEIEPARLEQLGLPDSGAHSSHRVLLSAGTSRPVLVATPSETHVSIARDCLAAGRDVFIEKPMAMETAGARELAGLARRQDRILMVGHLLLYQPAVHFVRQYLRQGKLGRVRRFHHDRLGRTLPQAANAGENVLWNLGVHDVALSLFFSSTEPNGIDASGQKGSAGVLEDVHVHLSYPGGVESWLHCSWVWPERVRRTTVVGEAGVLVYDELEQTVTLYPGLDEPPSKHPVRPSRVLYKGDPQPVRRELEHFLRCVQERRQPTSHAEHGVAVVEVIERALAVAGS